jgi:signal peptidase I
MNDAGRSERSSAPHNRAPVKGKDEALEQEKRPERSKRRQFLEFAGLLFAALMLRSFVAEPYEIPTGSMLPTVQIGDRLVISKLSYGARIPYTQSDQVRWGTPQRGDIVVLLNPVAGMPDLAKRVVALPGDIVAVREGKLWLNGAEVPEVAVPGPCSDDDRDERSGQWYSVQCAAFRQQLDGKSFVVHHVPGAAPPDFGPITVGPDQVFLMGDNRDRSLDSRYFGAVPIGKLKGKALFILWSSGPQGIRWSRLLGRIRPPA